jgi:hypothetical protein
MPAVLDGRDHAQVERQRHDAALVRLEIRRGGNLEPAGDRRQFVAGRPMTFAVTSCGKGRSPAAISSCRATKTESGAGSVSRRSLVIPAATSVSRFSRTSA